MNRRNLLGVLATIPLLRYLVPSVEAAPVKPRASLPHYTNREAIKQLIENYAAENRGDGVEMYDFGDSVTTMPLPDMSKTETTYLTSSICYLWIPSGKPFTSFPLTRNKAVHVGGQNYFIGVEFSYNSITPESLYAKLEKSRAELLQEAKRHVESLDAKS